MAAAAEVGHPPINGKEKVSITKNMLKRQKRKAKKKERKEQQDNHQGASIEQSSHMENGTSPSKNEEDTNNNSEITPDELIKDPMFSQFAHIFEKFNVTTDPEEVAQEKEKEKGEVLYNEDLAVSEEESEGDEDKDSKKLSNKKLRKLKRISIAELKKQVRKPEVVEWWDTAAKDPMILVQLKSTRNTVPVPQHWCQKRDYLAGKKGIEKPPFELPAYIADTGVVTQREAVLEKEANQKLSQKMRERVQPKMGKISLDYSKLHDAFFKYQTKPRLTKFGELYYEGKEFETKIKEKKPGDLSDELKEALNIPPLAPPPWLIAMQRYGPPPSYPNLKIPGLNAPIPEGAMWGFHPGGWGKPPIDEHGRPLYGDVFGVTPKNNQSYEKYAEPVEKTLWGEVEPENDEAEESEYEQDTEEEQEEEDLAMDTAHIAEGLETPRGIETPSGMQSVPSGLETPDYIQLRKERAAAKAAPRAPTEEDGPKELFTVITEKDRHISGFMGSQYGYDLSDVQKGTVLGEENRGSKRKKEEDYEVALDPNNMENLNKKTREVEKEKKKKDKFKF